MGQYCQNTKGLGAYNNAIFNVAIEQFGLIDSVYINCRLCFINDIATAHSLQAVTFY